MEKIYSEANTTTKIEPLSAIKILFAKVEKDLTGGELSEIGLVLIKALKRKEDSENEA